MWFKTLTGFEEQSPDQVRSQLLLQGKQLISKVNGRTMQAGSLQIATLKVLRQEAASLKFAKAKLTCSELVANVRQLHLAPDNKHALFQAASQFNLLEMTGPHITPEQGIDRYENDFTQGPACAISCGAGTIYRNYFVSLGNQQGQTHDLQIDCLAPIGALLENEKWQLWRMQNGYALMHQEGLLRTNALLAARSPDERQTLKDHLQIGLQWDTEVTSSPDQHLVSQAYCSALPVAYTSIDPIYWERFARIILEAAYEATLYAGLINYHKTGCPKVFLTLVGGGAFGNESHWITESLMQALRLFQDTPLEVQVVSYGQSDKAVRQMLNELR